MKKEIGSSESSIRRGRFLVTGGAGFIGSHWVKRLARAGHAVWVLDALTYAGHRENLEGFLNGRVAVQLIEGSVCDTGLLASLFHEVSFDAVFHLAAETHVDRSIQGPEVFLKTNIEGTFQVLEACLRFFQKLSPTLQKSFRYVQISTDEVFGALGETGLFSEASPFQPNSPYAASKASADLLARAWGRTYGLPVITTHCSNNYGSYQYPEKLIPFMIHRALAGESLPLYGTGQQRRDWIHVEDHCEGLWLAYEKGQPGQSYCFGGQNEQTNEDVVRAICRILDHLRPRSRGGSYQDQIVFVKDRLGHDFRYALDDRKAQNELGFCRKHAPESFFNSLQETVQWFLENEDWRKQVLREIS